MALVVPLLMLLVMLGGWMIVASFFGSRLHGRLICHIGGGATGLLAALVVLIVAAPAPEASATAAAKPAPPTVVEAPPPPAPVVAAEPPPPVAAVEPPPAPAPPVAALAAVRKPACDDAALEQQNRKAADAKFGKSAADKLSAGQVVTLERDLAAVKSGADVFSGGAAATARVVIPKGSSVKIAQRLVERDGRVWYQVHVPASDQWVFAASPAFGWLADTDAGRQQRKTKEDWVRSQIALARAACE
jgi:outer membrane biosynthesis protein TonB